MTAPKTEAAETAGIDVSGLDGDGAFALLQAVMVHPTDLARRERYLAFRLAEVAVDENDSTKGATIQFPARSFRLLVEAAADGVGADWDEAVLGGYIAGACLLTLLDLAAMRGEQVPDEAWGKLRPDEREKVAARIQSGGERLAQHVVSRTFRNPVVTNQAGKRLRGANPDKVEEYWQEYKTVSHLWAAFVVLHRQAEAAGVEDSEDWLDGLKLAGIAARLAEEAAPLKLPKTGRTDRRLLPATSPKVVGAPTMEVRRLGPSEFVLKEILSYTPQRSSGPAARRRG